MKKEKVENPKVHKYIQKEIPRIINSNSTFVKVFGGNFAEEKIKENILKVYTNEENSLYFGYFRKKNITICSKGRFGSKLRIGDIKRKKQILENVVHESIHAILYRDNPEGTGIRRYYNNKEDKEAIGEGLNEGYTVWLCKKLGFKGNSYKVLTRIVEEIECAVGEEKVISLGKGISDEHFYDNLGMDEIDGKNLIELTDDIYYINFLLKNLQRMKQDVIKSKNTEKAKDAIREYKECIEHVEKLENKSEKEDMLEYIKNEIRELKEIRREHIWDTEELIFENFFAVAFNMMEYNMNVTIEDLERLRNFQKLINSSRFSIPKGKENSVFARFIKTPIIIKQKEQNKMEEFRNRIKHPIKHKKNNKKRHKDKQKVEELRML